MNMTEKIRSLIRDMFKSESAVSDSLHHDPFKGHTEETRLTGKSYFDNFVSEYVGCEDDICNADDGATQDINLETIEERVQENVKIFILEAHPSRVIEECMGHSVLREPTATERKTPVPVGYDVTTKCPKGQIMVKRIHGCLQLTSKEVEYKEEETAKLTVVLTKEDQGWAVASVHPGEPGGDIGKFLESKGFQDGDVFDPASVDVIPWLFSHVVKA